MDFFSPLKVSWPLLNILLNFNNCINLKIINNPKYKKYDLIWIVPKLTVYDRLQSSQTILGENVVIWLI